MTTSDAAPGLPLPDWWQALAARASLLPARPRVALHLDGAPGAPVVGSIDPALAAQLRDAGLPLRAHDGVECVMGNPEDGLERIARWLHDQGLSHRWRDELLAVTVLDGADATPLARIERSAVRPLGITTRAVHLIAFTPLGRVWVQQRALDKATDPGQWDTLVGGLVAADETDAEALARETQEEAGLRIADLRELNHVDRLTIRRPVAEGYMVEHIEVFEAVVPAELEPRNEDGEVERFDCLAGDLLVRLIADGRFTLEAALMLAANLRRRGLV
jgi:8-oxo-dGTP pyrophosphatase MutT (NUDIX family)